MADGNEPKLSVQLQTDDAGHRTFVDSPDHRRYGVILKVKNAPPNTYAATFNLDSSTHYDPVHTLRPEPDGCFSLDTTTTDDFPVVVRLHRSKGEDLVLNDSITRSLRRSHAPGDDAAPIAQARSYVAEH
jgi:hypothetical protein